MRRLAVAALACFAILPFLARAAPAWNPAPWLADLAQIRAAIDHDYPNRDWLTGEREVSLDLWFGRTAESIRGGRNDADARRALDKLIERFNDGHIALRWPVEGGGGDPASSTRPSTVATFCTALGYDAGKIMAGTASALPGYRPIGDGSPFAAGIVKSGETTVGIVRIGMFSPQGYPTLCKRAVATTHVAIDKACDATCEDRLHTEAYALMTRRLMTTVQRLRAAGAQVLMVDLSRNGGGSEWAEAAARIVSPIMLRSALIGVLPGEPWVRKWRTLAAKLRKDARGASPTDHATLLDLARQADATADGLAPCPDASCSRLARAGFASDLLAELPAGRFDGKTWGPQVFSPAQFPYRDGVWTGPVIVLVDNGTWSAAEQFTALLRDNAAAIVMGTRTGGAGCGHIDGATPITLARSKATLELPNCVRFRKDGANEVSGIVPDVPTGVRSNDGMAYAGRLTAARLPDAVVQAKALSTH
jgi:hypothetical protein